MNNNSKTVRKLIKIVKGGEYIPPKIGRKYWYNLKKKVLSEEKWEFSYREQLNAISELGKSQSQEALTFLLELYNSELKTYSEDIIMNGQGSSDCNPYTIPLYHRMIIFPNTQGDLNKRLTYSLPSDKRGGGEWIDEPNEEEIEEAHNKARSSEPHKTLIRSIELLQQTV